MKNQILTFLILLFWFIPVYLIAQPCEDRELDFDGVNDMVQLAPSPITGMGAFTVEAKFRSAASGGSTSCNGNFKRLFSFIGSGRRLEVGECGGNPSIFWMSSTGNSSGAVSFGPNIRDGACHHLAVVYDPGQIFIYLDGTLVYNQVVPGTFSPFTTFRVGQWGGALSPNENWQGAVDEVRLWEIARTQMEINAFQSSFLTGSETGLEVYWKMNQGVPAGNNTGINLVTDLTTNGNDGTLFNFSLTPGLTSNFVCSGCLEFEISIKDYATRTIDLQEICSGDPVHFCLVFQDQVPLAYISCLSVTWEYNDGGGWAPLPGNIYSGICFPVAPGEIALDCSASVTGFLDRHFRASITSSDGCTFTSKEYPLRVCCPISPATISLNPATALCEGDDATIAVSLNSVDPFVMNPAGQVSIEWTMPDGTLINNQSTLNYQVSGASPPQECFDVVITNCAAKQFTATACITVDQEPVCGTITGMPNPPNLIPDLNDPDLYFICPGDDAAVGIATPFLHCNKNWQYSFDQITWFPLGISNNVQNTNILPSYYWPLGATSIFYQVECQPLSTPSGCIPCFSNIVEIRLLEAPQPDVIVGDGQICKGDFSLLTVSTPDPNLQYTWLCDGKEVGTGLTFNATEPACYWVEISNGCQVVETPWFCLEVCEIIPKISCPLPINECAYLGTAISITACDSDFAEPSASCSDNSGFTYTWTWTDAGGVSQSASGCDLMNVIPPASGTTFFLSIFDSDSGCTASDDISIIPCPPKQP
ncbi:MAG: LamG domain-containing protein [Saprospirales bacterium]|nr:LamG domain-containing protein [Saprospirales bacterium]